MQYYLYFITQLFSLFRNIFKLKNQLIAAMANDYRDSNHQCNLAMAKNIFATVVQSWGVSKNMKRQVIEILNIGLVFI